MNLMTWFWRRVFGVNDANHGAFVVASLAVLLLDIGAVVWFLTSRSGTIGLLRLHTTVGVGVDWVGPWWQMAVFPFCGALIFFVNGWLSGMLARRHRAFGMSLMFATGIIEIILAGAVVTAILLNS